MDIGTDASNLIITDGAKIIWQRPIPLGGNNFTRALTKELKLTFAKAEHLKRNAAKSPEMANILKAIKPVLTDFVGEVQRSLGYFTNTHRDAHVAYMVGLGSAFKLPGLQKYLGDKLSLEVRKPTKFARLGGDGVLNDPLFQENLLTFPVAYGLALQGLGQARLQTNLLPHEIRFDRVIRAKKPYAVAAAAMLLVGTVGLAWGFGEDLKSVSDKRLDVAQEKVKSAVSAYGEQENAFGAKKTDIENTQKDVKTIIAGLEERLNWPRFFEIQTAAMPRPGTKEEGGNLDDEKLWKGPGGVGVEALKWFKNRMAAGVKIEQALEDEASAHPTNLAMVNVEAVHTRWVTDPKAFLAAVDDAVKGDGKTRGFGEDIAETMKDDPNEREKDEEKGRFKPVWKKEGVPGVWVVEIRGYTDHKDGPRFVKAALMRNLHKVDNFAKDDNKVGKYIVGVADPVKGKVSHAFIYKIWMVNDAQPNVLVNINGSYLDRLLGGGTTAPGGLPGMDPRAGGPTPVPGGGPGPGAGEMGSSEGGMTATPAAVLGPAWSPLPTPNSSSGTAAGGAQFGGPPGTRGEGGPVPGGPTPVGGGMTGTVEKKEGVPVRRRYEFVVMFFWQEPTPSGDAAPPAAPTTPTDPTMTGGGP